MTKADFLNALHNALQGVPEADKACQYYSEIISDRVEDGMSEEEAVTSLDSIETIRARIIDETPLPAFVRQSVKPFNVLAIVLIIVGFPLWFGLGITLVSVVFSLLVALASLLFALFVMVFSIGLGGIALFIASFPLMITSFPQGLFMLGSGLLMIGLSLLLFSPAILAAQGLWKLCQRMVRWVKSRFIRRKTQPNGGTAYVG